MSKSIWSVQFSTKNLTFGAGIAVIDGNQIIGGEATLYYVGEFTCNGDDCSASVCVKKHGDGTSIFGSVNAYTLSLTGKITDEEISLAGYMIENPLLKVSVTMKKIIDEV